MWIGRMERKAETENKAMVSPEEAIKQWCQSLRQKIAELETVIDVEKIEDNAQLEHLKRKLGEKRLKLEECMSAAGTSRQLG